MSEKSTESDRGQSTNGLLCGGLPIRVGVARPAHQTAKKEEELQVGYQTNPGHQTAHCQELLDPNQLCE